MECTYCERCNTGVSPALFILYPCEEKILQNAVKSLILFSSSHKDILSGEDIERAYDVMALLIYRHRLDMDWNGAAQKATPL